MWVRINICKPHCLFFFSTFICCVCVCVEVRGQFAAVSSLLPPWGSLELTVGCQVSEQQTYMLRHSPIPTAFSYQYILLQYIIQHTHLPIVHSHFVLLQPNGDFVTETANAEVMSMCYHVQPFKIYLFIYF